eukprot:COSAG01_NODE_3238_length_6369_cov_37.413557_5_plen_49_part_01
MICSGGASSPYFRDKNVCHRDIPPVETAARKRNKTKKGKCEVGKTSRTP